MSGRFSKSEIDRLGERIRASDELARADLEALQAWRGEREAALIHVERTLTALGFHTTSRLKTHNTIVEKLRRERSLDLSRVQDIAGCRIVVRGGRSEQDQTVEQITGYFPASRVIDRRVKPSSGYRAVHLVVTVDGWPVEIQVRTALQDAWAQVFEQFADMYGRPLRYGGPPVITRPGVPWHRRMLAPVVERRVRMWERKLHRLSAAIDHIELGPAGAATEHALLAELAEVQRKARSLFRWWSAGRPT